MSLILYINGTQADLSPGQVIAQTRQVNDLNSLGNRQAGYTNKFSLPKTARNIKLLDYLTLPGNSSNVPYQKNVCSLYGESGECFVYNGWAVITDGGDSYDCVVYDGIIDLYKAIENRTLADLDLGELNHDKNHLTVAASWTDETLPYRYIIADYNGQPGYRTQGTGYRLDMDYLVPCANVAWLWQKIFDKYNNHTQPTGTLFSAPDFTNLWMTFPKGITSGEEQDIEVFLCEDIALHGTPNHDYSRYLIPLDNVSNSSAQYVNTNGLLGRHVRVLQSGTYRLELTGSFHINKTVAVKIGLNSAGITVNNITNTITLDAALDAQGDEGADVNYSRIMQLNANDNGYTKTGTMRSKGAGINFANTSGVIWGGFDETGGRLTLNNAPTAGSNEAVRAVDVQFAIPSYIAVTSAYTTGTARTITANGTFTITLATAGIPDGMEYCIKNIGSGTVTLSGTIDGVSGATLTAGQVIIIRKTGSAFIKIN